MKLIDYIQGKRRGKEANKLEREAMNDPFLQDAIDGFDAVPGNHTSAIEELEAQLERRINKPKPVVRYRFWIMGAAASLVLLLGIGSLLHLDTKLTPELAQKEKKAIIHSRKPIDSIERSEQPEVKIIAQNTNKPDRKLVSTPAETAAEPILEAIAEPAKPTPVNDIQRVSDSTKESNIIQGVSLSEQMAFKDNQTTTFGAVNTGNSKITLCNGLSGVVLDEEGKPITGASIRIGGTSFGTVSDMNGQFHLNIPQRNTGKVEASFIGYEKFEMPISNDSNTVIRLKPTNLAMNEVMVVGSGAKKLKFPTIELSEPLQGRLAGLDVSGSSRRVTFGEKEFRKYFEEKCSQTICVGEEGSIDVGFTIDALGRPTNIYFNKSACEELKVELTRLLISSPKWTITQRKVKMHIQLK
jgi:hypothetical protein